MSEIPEAVVNAIVSQHASPLAKEQAGELVEAWIHRYGEADSTLPVVAVEQPWSKWVDDKTLLVGVNDLVLEYEDGLAYGEWKTHREPRKKKDGNYYVGDSPRDWQEQMMRSIQLAIYARNAGHTDFLIRAAIKSRPPEFWEFAVRVSEDKHKAALHAVQVQADLIRAAREHPAPWRWPDGHKSYGRECVCTAPSTTTPDYRILSNSDPGSQAIEDALCKLEEVPRDLVVLSSSAYETSVSCMEAYRRSLLDGSEEDSEALDIGSCFHAGVAEWYRTLIKSEVTK